MAESKRLHRAARIEDWLHRKREGYARRRGRVPTVIAYTGYGSTSSVRVFCRVLLTNPNSAANLHPESVRGWRSFVSIPVGEAEVQVRIGSVELTLFADRGGVLDTDIRVDLKPGWHTAVFSTPGGTRAEAPVFVVAEQVQYGMLSDVDDTIMVTMLPRPLLAAWNTFVLNEHARIPTPGMAVLYDRFTRAHSGAPIVYLSTGAWNVAPTLRRFLSRNLFPPGPLLLTDWGPTHDRWFRSGKAHKRNNLDRLAAEFPNIKWVLVGDDGQHDIETYSAFAKSHPEQVAAIVIREMTGGEAVLAGGRAEHTVESPVPIVFGPDGASIGAELVKLGLLPN